MEDVAPPGRRGVKNWLGKYLVQAYHFELAEMGRQELKLYAVNIWIRKKQKVVKGKDPAMVSLERATG